MAKKPNTNLAQVSIGIDKITPEFLFALHLAGVRLCMWGEVGIGKTDVGEALAGLLTKQARGENPEHPGWEFRGKVVSHLLPEEISGLQIVDREKRQSYATRPAFMGDADKRYVLLLDEYNRAPQSYRNTLLQFLLSGRVGDHAMHKDSIIILAGNPTGADIVGLQRLSYADRNRIMHLNVYNDWSIWQPWAARNNVHPFVLGFLGSNQEKLSTEPTDASNEGFASPRTWKMASDILSSPYFVQEETRSTLVDGQQVERGTGQYELIGGVHREQLAVSINGLLGNVSAELFAYIDTLANLPSPQEILAQTYFPERDFGLQYATIASTAGWLGRKDYKSAVKGSNAERDVMVIPTNLNNDTFMAYVKLMEKIKNNGRGDMRLMAVRLLFKSLGFTYPNRPWNEANPTVLDHYLGIGKSREERIASAPHKAYRALIEEFITYFRDN